MNRIIKTTLTAGLTAALLDISGASIVYVLLLNLMTTQRLLQSVAAGALGKTAYDGGWNTAMLGLLCHTLIALSFAAFYQLIYPFWKKIFTNTFLAGIVYGCCVWSVMNLIVLPTALGRPFVFNAKYFFYGIGLIIFMVGIPIAFITERHRKKVTE